MSQQENGNVAASASSRNTHNEDEARGAKDAGKRTRLNNQ